MFFDYYPYTNFHNVNLDWVLQAVKAWGATVEANNQAFIDLKAANASFKTYVKTYLQNLDVSDEINDKLDQMLADGVLAPYMAPYIQTDVSAWLAQHITPTTPAVDNTLTISGAAADAAATGNKIKEDLQPYIITQLNSDNMDIGGIASNTGVETSGTSSKRTGYIDISEYNKIAYTRLVLPSSPTYKIGMAFYDTNRNYIAGEQYALGSELGYELSTVPVPNTAKYARFTWNSNISSSFRLYNVMPFDYAEQIEDIENIFIIEVKANTWAIGKYVNSEGAIADANNGALSNEIYPKGYNKIYNHSVYKDSKGNTYSLNVAQYGNDGFISRKALITNNALILNENCTYYRLSYTKFYGSERPDITQANIDDTLNVVFYVNLNNVYNRLDKIEQSIPTYSGKRISILGDSISTFVSSSEKVDGKAPEGCVTNYPGNAVQYQNSDVTSVSATWWGKVIEYFGMELGINESWAGSCIAYNPNSTGGGKYTAENCLCSSARIGHLGENGTPDLIIIFGGTNDINHHKAGATSIRYAVGELDTENNPYDYDNFPMVTDTYYGSITTMLLRIQHSYPNATILMLLPYFCTSTHTSATDIATPYDQNTWSNVAIDVCKYLGVDWLDLRTIINLYDVSTLLFDGLHPKANGMTAIANAVIHKLNDML